MSDARTIFLDLTGRRARTTNYMLVGLALAACIGMVVSAWGIVTAPQLRSPPSSVIASEASGPRYHRRFIPNEPLLRSSRDRNAPETARTAMRWAFYSEADGASLVSMKRNAPHLDGIVPDWLQLERRGARFDLKPVAERDATQSWIQDEAPHIAIYPRLTTRLPPRELLKLLVEPRARADLVAKIAEHLAENSFQGVAIELSGLPASAQSALVVFLDQLSVELHVDGRRLVVIAEQDAAGSRLGELARVADYVLVQTHDRSLNRHQAGPVAGQAWFEERLQLSLDAVPSSKLIVAIGSHGYDWDTYGGSAQVSVQQAWDLLARHDAVLKFDTVSLNPTFSYMDRRGRGHEVWFLDAVSAFNQSKAAFAVHPAGVAIWRLGLEDPGIWSFVGRGKLPDASTRETLDVVEPGYGAFGQVQGVLLSTAKGHEGSRETAYSSGLGLLVDQSMSSPPQQTLLSTWRPVGPKALALTFDDGPDPRFTPQVLDQLASKGVKATFYVVGSQVLAHPQLSRRIVAEGHDIGNHSFLHSNLFESRPERVAAELTATQRAFETQLGLRSILFRPPYAEAGLSYLERSPHLSAAASDLGYVFGGVDINPFDYLPWTADQIADAVIGDVLRERGQVILLHDSGGDRKATVDALPRIIDALKSKGYRFVTTHELVGLDREHIMQPYASQTLAMRAENATRAVAMRMPALFSELLPVLAISSVVAGIARLAFIVVAALVQRFRWSRREAVPFDGSVAVLVPAFNEEAVVCKTIEGLLASTMAERLTITVIDDGSSDRTSEVVQAEFAGDSRIKVYRKENGGKASALNHGIAEAETDVIVAIDGDTVLLPDAIQRLSEPFSDPSVGAVAGRVMVGNNVNLLTRFQALEYTIGQNLERTAFELFNAIGVVPGAIGAWRREALLQAGGYSTDTLAEDADLTVTLERNGWRVVSAPAAVALTEAPETLKPFMKQRFRWMFGTLQVAYKHAGALLERPRGVSLITLPNVFFQYAFTLLAPVMDLALLWILVEAVTSYVTAAGPADNSTLHVLALYWLAFQTVDLVTAGLGLALGDGRSNWRLMPLVVLQRVTYRQLLYVTAIRALLAALKGTFVGWGKLVRTGRVVQPIALSSSSYSAKG